jgi:hypothetical protein
MKGWKNIEKQKEDEDDKEERDNVHMDTEYTEERQMKYK